MKPIKVPDVPGPKGVCWVRDTRIPGNLVGAHCTRKKHHKGQRSWDRRARDDRKETT